MNQLNEIYKMLKKKNFYQYIYLNWIINFYINNFKKKTLKNKSIYKLISVQLNDLAIRVQFFNMFYNTLKIIIKINSFIFIFYQTLVSLFLNCWIIFKNVFNV